MNESPACARRKMIFSIGFGLVLLFTPLLINLLIFTPLLASEEMSVVRLKVDPDTVEKLLKEGEILIIKENEQGGRFKFVTAGILINATPDEVWKTITDYQHYPEFIPDCDKVATAPGDAENVILTSFTVAFKFSIIKYRIRYTLRQVHQKEKLRIDWTLKEGDLAEDVGAWELIPLEGGKKTAAFYSLYSDLRSLGYLVKYLFKEQPVMEIAITSTTAILMARAIKAKLEGKELK
ncbi:MAG: SRPBCC family protein [Proteobacteria bacterium]|nr:SRPBCC family protein [Pseudomonadota bacterium]